MSRCYLIFSVICIIGWSAPSSTTQAAIDRDQQLVGTFIANDFDFSQSLKVRRADHTFTEYRFQVLDYQKPPAIALTMQGRWALNERRYCETVTEASYADWSTLVGRRQCHDIVRLTPDLLQYFSRDSAPIRERRVSDTDAHRFTRDPFWFVSVTVRNKYGFERH